MDISDSIQIIAEAVRQHRKIAGLSQLKLAQLAGVGKTVIFDIEKGKSTIQLDTLLRVLNCLNIQFILKSPLKNSARET